MYHIIALIFLIAYGWIIIAQYFFDIYLLVFYFLYIAEFLGLIYMIKHKDEYFSLRTKEDLTTEKHFLYALIIFLFSLTYLMFKINLAYPITLSIYIFIILVFAQLYLVKKELTNYL